MYEIPIDEPTESFLQCGTAAGRHLQGQGGRSIRWLKTDPVPPFLEHLSFMIGNQVFFVRFEDANGAKQMPGSRSGLASIADGWGGHPCLMPMRRTVGGWEPLLPGWGLADLRSGEPIDPPSLVTGDPMEMTDWELHDFAVQVVRRQLEAEGRRQMSWQGNPSVDPSVWFVGGQGPEWVVVRAVRYPVAEAAPPANWKAIAARCAQMSRTGHFASVAAANADDPDLPLLRGHGLHVRYTGLERGPDAGWA